MKIEFFDELLKFLQQQYSDYGYLIVFFGALLENTVILGIILPGGTLVLGGAAFAANGTLSLPIVIFLGWMGLWLGNLTDYWIGRLGLYNLINKSFLKKYADPYMKQAEVVLIERGSLAILISYFLGAIRAFVSVTAGTVKYPFGKFAFHHLYASFIWNLLYCLAGYFLASTVTSLDSIVGWIGLGLVGVLFLGFAGLKTYEKVSGKVLIQFDLLAPLSKPATPDTSATSATPATPATPDTPATPADTDEIKPAQPAIEEKPGVN